MRRDWLKNLRKKKNLSQEQLAKECNVAQITISYIETGARRPRPELAKKLGKILEFDWIKFYE